jgi:hypothetical protein
MSKTTSGLARRISARHTKMADIIRFITTALPDPQFDLKFFFPQHTIVKVTLLRGMDNSNHYLVKLWHIFLHG